MYVFCPSRGEKQIIEAFNLMSQKGRNLQIVFYLLNRKVHPEIFPEGTTAFSLNVLKTSVVLISFSHWGMAPLQSQVCLCFASFFLDLAATAAAHLSLPFLIICMNYHWCAWAVSRHWHRDGEDRALSEANALIYHPNIEPSVERNHCLQQAHTQE